MHSRISKRNRRDILIMVRELRSKQGVKYAKWERFVPDVMCDLGLTMGLETWDDIEDAVARFLNTRGVALWM